MGRRLRGPLLDGAAVRFLSGALAADRRAAGSFLDRWASAAITCGWSDLDVFGCDRDRPDARFDCMGLVMLLDRVEVAGIDPIGADLIARAGGAKLRFRRRALPRHTVSLWDLNRS